MRIVLNVMGVLLMLAGGVWFLQASMCCQGVLYRPDPVGHLWRFGNCYRYWLLVFANRRKVYPEINGCLPSH